MNFDEIELRNKAVSLIVEVYFGAGQAIDAQQLTAEAEVLYQWLLTGAKLASSAPEEGVDAVAAAFHQSSIDMMAAEAQRLNEAAQEQADRARKALKHAEAENARARLIKIHAEECSASVAKMRGSSEDPA